MKLKPEQVTLGVPITFGKFNISVLFNSCVYNDSLSKYLKFVIIDNACQQKIEPYIESIIGDIPCKIIRNESIESLSYNQNLIYKHSETDYIIFTGEETFFRKNWLSETIDWVNNNTGRFIAHISRGTKGMFKATVPQMNYFNLLISGKDGTDSDVEYREYTYLENRFIDSNTFKTIVDKLFIERVIGGIWELQVLNDPLFYDFNPISPIPAWTSKLIYQPDYPNKSMGDSNFYLNGSSLKSERNKSKVDVWSILGKQDWDLLRGLLNE